MQQAVLTLHAAPLHPTVGESWLQDQRLSCCHLIPCLLLHLHSAVSVHPRVECQVTRCTCTPASVYQLLYTCNSFFEPDRLSS
jgi:hypothetical protein